YADAAQYIRQGGLTGAVSPDLASLAIPANLRAGRIEDALRVARSAAELRPGDPLPQLWYAQTLALAGRAQEAEPGFRAAIRLAPRDVRAWSGLVWFYGRERRQTEGRQALQDLIAAVELTPYERLLVLARGSEVIGDRAEAENYYKQAVA